MSAFDKQVRAQLSAQRGTPMFEAAAEAVAAGNTIEELVQIVIHATRAYEIKSKRAREAHAAGTARQRQALASYGAEHGLADDHGNVSRLDVKRELRRAQTLAHAPGCDGGHPSSMNCPAPAQEGPSEPRTPSRGIILPEPDLEALEALHAMERGRHE